jgi:predicted RND superfamily exporter protein
LNEKELEVLLNDEHKFMEFCLALPQLRDGATVLRELKESNEALARKNLEKEEVIEQTRAQLFAIHEQLEKQKESYEDVYEQVQAVIKERNPKILLKEFKEFVDQTERESDEVSTEFLSGDLGFQEFIDKYELARTIYYLRLFKYEKFKEYLESNS